MQTTFLFQSFVLRKFPMFTGLVRMWSMCDVPHLHRENCAFTSAYWRMLIVIFFFQCNNNLIINRNFLFSFILVFITGDTSKSRTLRTNRTTVNVSWRCRDSIFFVCLSHILYLYKYLYLVYSIEWKSKAIIQQWFLSHYIVLFRIHTVCISICI